MWLSEGHFHWPVVLRTWASIESSGETRGVSR
jgi:hypothetical protein